MCRGPRKKQCLFELEIGVENVVLSVPSSQLHATWMYFIDHKIARSDRMCAFPVKYCLYIFALQAEAHHH